MKAIQQVAYIAEILPRDMDMVLEYYLHDDLCNTNKERLEVWKANLKPGLSNQPSN